MEEQRQRRIHTRRITLPARRFARRQGPGPAAQMGQWAGEGPPAQMLVETARAQFHELGITEADVLRKIGAGLPATDLGLTEGETEWVVGRLAETLGWVDERGQPISG